MDSTRQPELPCAEPVIDSFTGTFGFLSNFHEASIWLDGVRYPSVEHAYQAAKSSDPVTQKMIREARSPGVAKRLGQSCQLAPDWDARKVEVMRMCLSEKFKNPLLRAMLLATEEAELIEGNSWNDRFWGVCRGAGQNWLGKLLMETRERCKAEDV